MSAAIKLKLVRKHLNMNQSTFAKALGIKQSYLSALESGKREPNSKLLYQLLEKFDISVDWFITGKGSIITNSDNSQENDLQKKETGEMYASDVRFHHKDVRLEDDTREQGEDKRPINDEVRNILDYDALKVVKSHRLLKKYIEANPGTYQSFEDLNELYGVIDDVRQWLNSALWPLDSYINSLLSKIKTENKNVEEVYSEISGLITELTPANIDLPELIEVLRALYDHLYQFNEKNKELLIGESPF